MLSFTKLRAANVERDKAWDPDNKLDISFRIIELLGECGEASNIVKKLIREKLGLRGSRTTKAKLAEELADIVICADLCAMEEGIDLGQEVIRKFNQTSKEQGFETFLSEEA